MKDFSQSHLSEGPGEKSSNIFHSMWQVQVGQYQRSQVDFQEPNGNIRYLQFSRN